jgi:hypothetical protein
MMKVRFLNSIRPALNEDELEPVRKYCRRVQRLLPNFPSSVIVQWLHRHFPFVARRYQWLDFDCLVFEQQVWSTDRILAEVVASDQSILESRRHILWSDKYGGKSWLEVYMIRRGTWPRPIIVLENVAIPRRAAKHLHSPFHLLEGHRRAGYLRGLADRGCARSAHAVWVVRWSKRGAG